MMFDSPRFGGFRPRVIEELNLSHMLAPPTIQPPQAHIAPPQGIAQAPQVAQSGYNQAMFNAPRMRLADLISQYRGG